MEEHAEYVHNIEFKEEDYEETVATTVDETRALGRLAGQSTMKQGLTAFRCTSTENLNVSEA